MFLNRLKAKLQLKLGSKTHEVPAGNIKIFNLDMGVGGFSCDVLWWFNCSKQQSEDTLFDLFIKEDRIDATLTLDRAFDKEGESTESLVINGIVRAKTVRERAFTDLTGQPILQRRYEVEFADPAEVLWGQHRPTRIYVDKTLKDLIEDNKPSDLKITYTWTGLTTKYPVLAVGLGGDETTASFYDWLQWLLDRENAALLYDAAKKTYRIINKKDVIGKEEPLVLDDVEDVTTHYPVTRRATRNIVNAATEAATKTAAITNSQSVKKVEHDMLIRSSIAKVGTERKKLETARTATALPYLAIDYARYPSITTLPGMVYNFKEDWSDKYLFAKKKYWLEKMSIRARAESQEPTDDDEAESNAFEMEFKARFEQKEDPVFARPDYVRPVYPFQIEGKVLSEVGKDDEKTYKYYTDKDTSLDFYKIKIPLFKDIKVIVAYEPLFAPGHFYFPAYKDERVLVEFDFQEARIARFLDWKPGSRLTQETQGNHLLLGKKNETSQTSMRHIYDGTKPLLRIERKNEKDNQKIEVSEGRIFLSTEEKEK